MSWSVQAAGKVAAVKRQLDEQFYKAQAGLVIPSELEACKAAQTSINASLAFLEDANVPTAVNVQANGTAYGSDFSPPEAPGEVRKNRQVGLNVKIEAIHGYVE